METTKICPQCKNEMGIRCSECSECGYDYFKNYDKPMETNNNQPEKTDILGFKIGDIVPYVNTASKIVFAEITEFKVTDAKNPNWFYGLDTKTDAKVWYSLHESKKLHDFASQQQTTLIDEVRKTREQISKLDGFLPYKSGIRDAVFWIDELLSKYPTK